MRTLTFLSKKSFHQPIKTSVGLSTQLTSACFHFVLKDKSFCKSSCLCSNDGSLFIGRKSTLNAFHMVQRVHLVGNVSNFSNTKVVVKYVFIP